MIKINLLAWLIAGLAVMAMSAVPAGAWFKSLNDTSHGVGEVGRTNFAVGGAKVGCEKAEGEWKIQTKGQWWERGLSGKQEAALEGPHLYLKVSKWNGCSASIVGVKVPFKIEACEVQIAQEREALSGTATVIRECIIQTAEEKGAPACTIRVFAGSRKQTEPINELLTGITLENSGKESRATASIEHLHGRGSCLLPEEFTGAKFETEKGGVVGDDLNII
jgi:hypothetical protein